MGLVGTVPNTLVMMKNTFQALLYMKQAEIIPLFKEGDKSNPSNYRPISILPAASKLLEKVHKQVYSYLSQHQFFSKAQFGFRKAHSTTTCIVNLLDKIYKKYGQWKIGRSDLPGPEKGL